MNLIEAFRKAGKGDKIRRENWKPGIYLYTTDHTSLMWGDGEQYEFDAAHLLKEDWEVVSKGVEINREILEKAIDVSFNRVLPRVDRDKLLTLSNCIDNFEALLKKELGL